MGKNREDVAAGRSPSFYRWPLQEDEVYLVAGRPAEHWALEFMGAFAGVQNGIETLLAFYLSRFSPELSKAVAKRHFARLSDDERWTYVKAWARDAGYTGELLEDASNAFWRCKRVRDFLGHPRTALVLARDFEDATYCYQVPEDRRALLPDPLTPEALRVLGAECRWLQAFLDHIGSLAGLPYALPMARVGPDGKPETRWIEMLEPSRLPIGPDWTNEGLFREMPAREPETEGP
ncbi:MULTISPECIES: hypothetical protein [Miniimonas]|uniref:hypothetical protein n=1 Tax=Miniimonas TaxID=947525 RepID=UPI00131F1455|nr:MULTISPECIES: hypothetical protein [Miniimonas]